MTIVFLFSYILMFLNAHKTVNYNIFQKSFCHFVENLKRNKMRKNEKTTSLKKNQNQRRAKLIQHVKYGTQILFFIYKIHKI